DCNHLKMPHIFPGKANGNFSKKQCLGQVAQTRPLIKLPVFRHIFGYYPGALCPFQVLEYSTCICHFVYRYSLHSRFHLKPSTKQEKKYSFNAHTYASIVRVTNEPAPNEKVTIDFFFYEIK